MICGGSFRRKRLINDDIYGFLPSLNRLRIDENEENGIRELQNSSNTSDKKEKKRNKITRSNSYKNSDTKSSNDHKKKGIFRSSSFKLKNLVDRKQEEQKEFVPKSILKKNTGKYESFGENQSDYCDRQTFMRSQSMRIADFECNRSRICDNYEMASRNSFRRQIDESLSRIDENINRNSFRPIINDDRLRIDDHERDRIKENIYMPSERLVRIDDDIHHQNRNESRLSMTNEAIYQRIDNGNKSFRPVVKDENVVRIDDSSSAPTEDIYQVIDKSKKRNAIRPIIKDESIARMDDCSSIPTEDIYQRIDNCNRNTFRPITNNGSLVRIDERIPVQIEKIPDNMGISENDGLERRHSFRLSDINEQNRQFVRSNSLRVKNLNERIYEGAEFIRANSFRIRQQFQDKALVIDETKGLSRTSSFKQKYEKMDESDVSETTSVASSSIEEPEELEGSLRARIYRRRHTVVIVCRNKGLDKVGSGNAITREVQMRPLSSDLNPPRMDCYRFSMVNMEDSQDVDLEAILGELNALDSQFEEALQSAKNGDVEVKEEVTSSVQGGASARTHSPDNDSAFSDCVSLLSSESSASSGRSTTDSHCPGEQISNSKAEKIKLALQKMKEASVKKLFVKVFNEDCSAKCLLVDEVMTCGYVTRILAEKNHTRYSPNNALVEHLTDLHMKRVYDDDELLVDQLMEWTRDSKNRLIFSPEGRESHARTLLFSRPQSILYSVTSESQIDKTRHPYTVLEEFFASNSTPTVEGPLYIKTDSKKGWKKHHCILRASGLYFYPKDRAKSSSKDLVCLATFDNNQVYYGVSWRKKYKAPTDFCFALKHPTIQQLTNKSSKYIKYLCADDEFTMEKWVIAIRVIKRGRQLLVNHKAVTEQAFGMADNLSIPADRISVCSSIGPPVSDRSSGEFLTRDRNSCGSNGVESDSGSSSGCDMAFEADFPQGTIKRKPPKLPLTATTRQLKEIAIGTPVLEEERAIDECEGLPPPPPELLEPPSMEYPEPPPPPPPPRTQPRQSQVFLKDLARVMSKKWQVAQKCKMEEGTSPHEVLGFRDPDDYATKENSVSQWVAEHYGSTLAPNQDCYTAAEFGSQEFPAPPEQFTAPSLYENVYRAPPTGGVRTVQRRPPPPPPRRAITTHLTTVTLQQNS